MENKLVQIFNYKMIFQADFITNTIKIKSYKSKNNKFIEYLKNDENKEIFEYNKIWLFNKLFKKILSLFFFVFIYNVINKNYYQKTMEFINLDNNILWTSIIAFKIIKYFYKEFFFLLLYYSIFLIINLFLINVIFYNIQYVSVLLIFYLLEIWKLKKYFKTKNIKCKLILYKIILKVITLFIINLLQILSIIYNYKFSNIECVTIFNFVYLIVLISLSIKNINILKIKNKIVIFKTKVIFLIVLINVIIYLIVNYFINWNNILIAFFFLVLIFSIYFNKKLIKNTKDIINFKRQLILEYEDDTIYIEIPLYLKKIEDNLFQELLFMEVNSNISITKDTIVTMTKKSNYLLTLDYIHSNNIKYDKVSKSELFKFKKKNSILKCIICKKNKQDAVVLDCYHTGYCVICAIRLMKEFSYCSICKLNINIVLKISNISNNTYKVLNTYIVNSHYEYLILKNKVENRMILN